MADQNVKNVQIYLNTIFKNSEGWILLEENGNTGTIMMEALVRAFQIENGINPSGVLGPATLNRMKNKGKIYKMDATDSPRVDVCLIQCALFCKGYSAGGITGIYYTNGVNAVKQMQSDAGLTASGVIDWKVWQGLLSMFWFKSVFGGDSNILLIQQQLNRDYSDYIGMGPCDGITQRHTALGILAALQLESNVLSKEWIPDLNELNFGPMTAVAFPNVLKEGQNTATYLPYNRILQYALYFNNYNPGRFDGIYDSSTKNAVSEFQAFAKLDVTGLITLGQVNSTTIHSLLDSRGDPNRLAKACDCATVLNRQQALDLKVAGYTHVGRYLTGSVGNDFIPKFITQDEIANIKNAGLSIFPIYQDGGWYLEYFARANQGIVDAHTAIKAAKRIGIAAGTTIYFAVDFDCYGYQITDFVIPYFKKLKTVFRSEVNDKNYKLGVYVPRLICSQLCNKGWTEHSFVAGMSTKFSCNLGYPLPQNWAFDQFHEFANTEYSPGFPSSPTFPLDKAAYSGRDVGCKIFDTVPIKDDETLQKENENDLIEQARNQYVYDFLEPFNLLDGILGGNGIKYGHSIPFVSLSSPDVTITGTIVIEADYKPSINPALTIETDNTGELKPSLVSQIDSLTTDIAFNIPDSLIDSGYDTKFNKLIKEVCFSIKTGSLTYSFTPNGPNSVTVGVEVTSEKLVSTLPNKDSSITIKLEYTITFTGPMKPDPEQALKALGVSILVLGSIALVSYAAELGVAIEFGAWVLSILGA